MTSSFSTTSSKWFITFITNTGDLEMIDIHDFEDIKRQGATITIIEEEQGNESRQDAIGSVSDTEPHVVRVAAITEAGIGLCSDNVQNEGSGGNPIAVVPLSPPKQSSLLAVTAISNYQIVHGTSDLSTSQNAIFISVQNTIFITILTMVCYYVVFCRDIRHVQMSRMQRVHGTTPSDTLL